MQTLAGTVSIHDPLNGVSQTIAEGSDRVHGGHQAAGQQRRWVPQRQLGHPFENPTGLTNWLSIYLLLAIPFSLTYTFGKMVGSIRQGAALLAAMVIIFGVWVGGATFYEHQNNPAVAAAGVTTTVGNTEGNEVRFGDTSIGRLRGVLDEHVDGLGRCLLRLVHADGWLLPHQRHDARRGDARGRRERPLHHPHLRHHRRVHRRPDDRTNAGVSGEEDPGQRNQTRGSRGPRHAADRADLHGHRRLNPRRPAVRSTPFPTGSPRSSTG